MPSVTTFDYAIPYDIMVGVWDGMSTTFDLKGEYAGTVPSRVAIYWVEPGILHYEQDELADFDALLDNHPDKDAFRRIVTHDFDLKIEGKACSSLPNAENVKCVGAETSPGIYLFHLTFPNMKKRGVPAKKGGVAGHYYNNQYFTNPNERHIIGPWVPGEGHDFAFVVAQTFTRRSYDVPHELRSKKRSKRR